MTSDATATPQLLLENQLCFPLYSAANAVIRAYRPLLDELDLTYLQYIVLMVFWQETSLNVKELGQRLKLDSGTLTPLLKRLENKGLVERRRSEVDERVRIITVTDMGMELRGRARNIPAEVACTIGMTESQRGELRTNCELILAALDE